MALPLLPGMKITFVPGAFDMELIVSKYLICMAAGVFKISAASLINLADSTSARAMMILASPMRICLAADDRVSCNSLLKMISLMSTDSTLTPHDRAGPAMMFSISCAMASRFSIESCSEREPRHCRNVVWVRSMRADRTLDTLFFVLVSQCRKY